MRGPSFVALRMLWFANALASASHVNTPPAAAAAAARAWNATPTTSTVACNNNNNNSSKSYRVPSGAISLALLLWTFQVFAASRDTAAGVGQGVTADAVRAAREAVLEAAR